MQRNETRQRKLIQRVAGALTEPARILLGYHELVAEQVTALGLSDVKIDVERVTAGARELIGLIDRMQDGTWITGQRENGQPFEATIRHDLRTPLNAILGYSEMVAEELEETAPASLMQDISLVLANARQLLADIDRISAATDDQEAEPDKSTLASKLITRSASTPGDGTAPETGRILVIDDVAANRDLLERRLGRDGHEVACAASGKEALRAMEGNDFDLVLLDVLMPDMNGLEVLAKLKSEPRWRGIPVIMISGLKENETVVRCIQEGAEDYLPKPFDPVLLRARITAGLERKHWRDREQRYLQRIEYERDRADALLAAILPRQIVTRLNSGEKVIADRMEEATILFADIVGFTPVAAKLSPNVMVERLSRVFSAIDQLAQRHGIEKIKTIGDAYMAAAGVPEPNPKSASAMVAFAIDTIDAIRHVDPEFRLRIGIHTGPVVAGLIGDSRFIYDIWGHTVNVASRLEAFGTPDRILISDATAAKLEGKFETEAKAILKLKGAGEIATYKIAL